MKPCYPTSKLNIPSFPPYQSLHQSQLPPHEPPHKGKVITVFTCANHITANSFLEYTTLGFLLLCMSSFPTHTARLDGAMQAGDLPGLHKRTPSSLSFLVNTHHWVCVVDRGKCMKLATPQILPPSLLLGQSSNSLYPYILCAWGVQFLSFPSLPPFPASLPSLPPLPCLPPLEPEVSATS